MTTTTDQFGVTIEDASEVPVTPAQAPVAGATGVNDFMQARMAALLGEQPPATAPVAAPADSKQVTFVEPTAAPQEAASAGPQRDPATGKFVKAEAPAETQAAPAQAPQIEGTKATDEKSGGGEPLVEVPGFGVKLPFSQALEVFKHERESAAQHIQAEKTRLESELASRVAAAEAKEREAMNIIALYRQNPEALAAILGTAAQDPEIVAQSRPAAPQPPQMSVEETVKRILAERESAQQKAESERLAQEQTIKAFDSAVQSGFESVIDPKTLSPELLTATNDLITFWMARDRAEGKFTPFAHPHVVRAQAAEYARRARGIIMADHQTRVQRQTEIVKNAPVAVNTGNTMMPRVEQPMPKLGGLNDEYLRNQVLSRLAASARRSGVEV